VAWSVATISGTPKDLKGYSVLDSLPFVDDVEGEQQAIEAESIGSTVAIGYVHPGQGVVGEPFAQSLGLNAGALGPRLHSITSTSSADPMLSRNKVIETVLEADPQPDWFLWWDTDMSLPPEAAIELVRLAELHDAQAATCFGLMMRPNHRDWQPWTPVPNAYWRFEEDQEDTYILDQLPSEVEPFWCDATGFGFTLIRPQVFRDFPEEHLPWHVRTAENWGQDIRFFYHALPPGSVLYCPSIRSIHWRELGMDWNLWVAANQEVAPE
jgi:hypothetical protein